MAIYKDLLIFIIGFLLIIKSADLFTAGAEGIAQTFRIPRIIIGLTIVSIGTTAPEFFISTVSSYMGASGMAVGNAVGSCLLNIGLILAIASIIRTIVFEPKFIKQELLFLIICVIILSLLTLDGILTFKDGILLLLLLLIFYWYVFKREFINSKEKERESLPVNESAIKPNLLKFLIGIFGIILSAKYAIIPSGINIAHCLNVPEIVIGLSMVALGTSLPELVTAIVASFKNMGELAAGNIIGANILNILLVLGCSSMINPLNIDIQTQRTTLPIVLLITLLLFLFLRKGFSLNKKRGIILLVIYIGYIIYIFKFAYG